MRSLSKNNSVYSTLLKSKLVVFLGCLLLMPSVFGQMTANIITTSNTNCNGTGCNYSGPTILINEIMLCPTTNDGSSYGSNNSQRGEWIELYNPDLCQSIDISCYYLGNNTSDGGSTNRPGGFVIPQGTIVPPSGFVIIRGSNAPAVASNLLIANGGNTGSSGGPHLHFEIRDSLDRALDPLLAGYSEILDRTPPTPQKIAIVPLELDSRVNGKFQRVEVTPVLSGANYRIPETIQVSGKVGLEIQGYDKLDGAENQNGFPRFEVSDDSGLLFKLLVDKVDFNFTRHFLLHTHLNRFTKLYHQKDLKFSFITPHSTGTGALELEPGKKKNIQVKLIDAYNNTRIVQLNLAGADLDSTRSDGAAPPKAQVSYYKNIMKIKVAQSSKGGLAKFEVGNTSYEILPAYQDAASRTYLWDLRFGIPKKIDLCSEIYTPDIIGHFPVDREHVHANAKLQIRTDSNSLLEDLYLRVSHSGSANAPVLNLGETTTYLWNPIEATWDVSGFAGNKAKTQVYQRAGNGALSYLGGEWIGNQIRFKTRNFGSFVLAEDATKPSISPIRVNAQGMRFTIKDNLSGIKNFEAYVNGEWVWMRYEHKQAVIWSEPMNGQSLKGPAILRVTDQAGNVAEWRGTLN